MLKGSPTKTAKFSPFSGSSRRLNGNLSSQSAPLASSALLKQHQKEDESRTVVSESPSALQHSRKLVFGSNINKPRSNETKKDSKKNTKPEAPSKMAEPKFQAFTGKKYSLKS